MLLSVSMLDWGWWAKGWGRWRELPVGGIHASQGTFSSFMKIYSSLMSPPTEGGEGWGTLFMVWILLASA